jgi:hypothetical protein
VAPRSGRRWLLGAVAFFLVLLLGWVVLALQLNTASAGPLPYSRLLFSNLDADYGPDRLPRALTSIRLTILEEAMRALGMSEDEIEAQQARIELAMGQPVPTATALNFEGDAPFTPTPTLTWTPTDTATPTPTHTATATRRPPTRTPTKTSTRRPTRTPGPTNTPSGGDTDDPEIESYDVSPSPGDLSSCDITVNDLHVTDAIGSSGIADSDVGVKYYDPNLSDYVYLCGNGLLCAYTQDMTRLSGGAQGDTSWDAHYTGTFTIRNVVVSLVPGSSYKLAMPAATSEDLDFYVFAWDLAGNFAAQSIGTYTLLVDCS